MYNTDKYMVNKQSFSANKKRLVETFIDLVKIDSPSGGEDKIAREMIKRLKNLGGTVERDSYGNIIAKFAGVGEPLMLNSHLDTVEPGQGIKPKVTGNKVTSDGSTILGADDKAGLSVLLEALAVIKEDKVAHIPLEIVLTKGEEVGLFGAKNLDYTKISATEGVCFDGHSGVDNITVAAPGLHTVDATIIGRAAHAGVEPEKGISAIQIAARIISELQIGRIDNETTANIGLIEGGSARNAVAELAHFKGEIRSHSLEKIKKHATHFQEVFKKIMGDFEEAEFKLEIVNEANPFNVLESDPIIQKILRICKKLKIKPSLAPTGGLSDVNIFSEHGLSIVDVGAGAHELHTTREYLDIKEFIEAANFAVELITYNK